jgi:hypothetical protein
MGTAPVGLKYRKIGYDVPLSSKLIHCHHTVAAVATNLRLWTMAMSPWWWRQQGPLKRWKTSTRLHGATTQKTAILVFIQFLTLRFYFTLLCIDFFLGYLMTLF